MHVLKFNAYGKLFLISTFSFLLIILLVRLYLIVLSLQSNLEVIHSKIVKKTAQDVDTKYVAFIKKVKNKKEEGIKYILQWTSPNNKPFKDMGKGQRVFIKRNCKHQNCFVTSDRNYFDDYTKFDAVAFSVPELTRMPKSDLPAKRSPEQKYILVSKLSDDNYEFCDEYWEGFFNWTWTYRFDSEIKFEPIAIRNINGTLIWPNGEINWIKPKDMKPVNKDMRRILKGKTKTIAAIATDCKLIDKYEYIIPKIRHKLKKVNKTRKVHIDIYGSCGGKYCNESACGKIVEKDYFFVLIIDNLNHGIINDKVLYALQNKAIPIMINLGAANYSRFMPDGAYLNAMDTGPQKLAKKLNKLMNDMDKYTEYFKWTNHYKYEKGGLTAETDDYCRFCSALNQESEVKQNHKYDKFREWWNPPDASCM